MLELSSGVFLSRKDGTGDTLFLPANQCKHVRRYFISSGFGALVSRQEYNYCGIQWLRLYQFSFFSHSPPLGFNSTIKNGKGFGLEIDKNRAVICQN